MIVGDPLQAIYAFRGGNSKYILNLDKDYSNTKVINLNVNYRCSKEIVNTANKLALCIPDSKHKNYVESVAYHPSYKAPEVRGFEDEYSEATWISEKILNLKKRIKKKRKIKYPLLDHSIIIERIFQFSEFSFPIQ